MIVSKEKQDILKKRMKDLKIFEKDILEKFILGSGKGGQKVNKTSSCVYLKHLPTNIEIKHSKDRSRECNRYHARKELCEKIEAKIFLKKNKKEKESYKIKKQKKRRSRKSKEKILEDKRKRSEKIKHRKVSSEDIQ